MAGFQLYNLRMTSLQLRGKLLLIFGIVTLMSVAAVSQGFLTFDGSLQIFHADVAQSQNNAIKVVALEANFKRQVQEWKDTLLRGKKPEAFEKHWSNFQQREVDVSKAAEQLSQSIPEPNAARMVVEFGAAHKKMGEAYRRGVQEFKDHNFDSAVGDAAVAGIDRAPTELLTKAKDHLVSQAFVQAQEAYDSARHGMLVSIALFVGATVAGAGLFLIAIQRGITAPLARVNEAMRQMADGNLNITIARANSSDEIGAITKAVIETVDRMGATIGGIRASTREVTNASAEISTSTTDLSQRTEEQAASLEQTSASMEEMTATVKKNAENALEASTLALNTQEVADRGGQVVAKTVSAMARIEESSRKIADIIGVIDEIARQTNLLALNAAVEAARAGEAGRGFAVVASEVRSLAQRSSQAAKDIKDLITSSNGQVKDGVELVNKAGESLHEIVESIKKVSAVVSEIANASAEQSTGIEEINKALTQMDEVTQQNSALVEENAATAKTLEGQAKSMDERVAFFRLRDRVETGVDIVSGSPPQLRAVSRKAEAPIRPVVALKSVGAGSVTRLQTGLAVALKTEPNWKEF